MERVICEIDPDKPSLAADKQLDRQLTGDLDNIVLTAMRREPQRRYASAAEFSEDLRRHLEALPILARDDRWTYRAGKFIRRNRLMVGVALLLAFSLIGGIAATSIQARRAEQRFQIVRGLARTMLFDLYNEMERLPGSISLRASTIRTVVNYLDALAQSGSQDPDLDLELANAYERVANLEGNPFVSNLGHGTEALTNYRKALTMFERLAARRRQGMRGLIDMHLKIAGMESLFGNRFELIDGATAETVGIVSSGRRGRPWNGFQGLSALGHSRVVLDESAKQIKRDTDLLRKNTKAEQLSSGSE